MKLSSKFSFVSRPLAPDARLRRAVTDLDQILRQIVRAGRRLDDEHYRKHALLRIEQLTHQIEPLARGKLTFQSTETWRAVYEDVLSSCAVKRYLSVALVRTEEYWRDTPGSRSIQFNGLLVEYGFYVHRILIIDDFLWPPSSRLPSKELHAWILSQYSKGIQIGLVRSSELEPESDLLVDFGIYGDAAVGYQVTDEVGQTVRYEMSFGSQHVHVAEDRWKRLSLYARQLESI